MQYDFSKYQVDIFLFCTSKLDTFHIAHRPEFIHTSLVHAFAFVDVSACFVVTWRNALVCRRGTSECARGYICLVACYVNEAENDIMFVQ